MPHDPDPPYQGTEPHLFFSYAHDDPGAHEAIAGLQAAGINVWYDSGIPAGDDWREHLADRLAHATAFVAAITPAWAASQYCRQELLFALDAGKPVLPVMFEPVDLTPGLKMSLRDRQWLDVSNDPANAAETLAAAVRRLLGVDDATEEEAPTRAMPTVLEIRCGDSAHQLRPSFAGRYVVGRGADCNFRLQSDFVSRQHGYFRALGGGFAFGDTSKNGTTLRTVEGETLIHQTEMTLPAKGSLRMADLEIQFTVDDDLTGA